MNKSIALLLAGLGTACGGSDDGSLALEGRVALDVGFANLADLGEDYVYEGWVIVDGAPVTTGRFSVDADGALTPGSFSVSDADAAAATKFVLTIEPAVGDDPAPADTHILAGDFNNGIADLSPADPAALGTDFTGATGEYVLATPTTAANTDDNDQGIWWLVPPGMPPASGLSLPELPAGWVYEGWVVGPDGPISTGRFTDSEAADDDGAGPTAGPDGFPPRAGQDFIDPAIVLGTDYAAVLTVEPEPDNSPMPFSFKPLVDPTIDDVAFPATQSMANMAVETNPSGTAAFN